MKVKKIFVLLVFVNIILVASISYIYAIKHILFTKLALNLELLKRKLLIHRIIGPLKVGTIH